MEIALIIVVVIIALLTYEYRFRKPDRIVVYETRDGVGIRKARLYPRHFSMPITKTAHSFAQTIEVAMYFAPAPRPDPRISLPAE